MLIRGGGPSSGYVSTGFFGGKYLGNPFVFLRRTYFFKLGLTLGRIVMVEVTKKVNTSYHIQQFQAILMTRVTDGSR